MDLRYSTNPSIYLGLWHLVPPQTRHKVNVHLNEKQYLEAESEVKNWAIRSTLTWFCFTKLLNFLFCLGWADLLTGR